MFCNLAVLIDSLVPIALSVVAESELFPALSPSSFAPVLILLPLSSLHSPGARPAPPGSDNAAHVAPLLNKTAIQYAVVAPLVLVTALAVRVRVRARVCIPVPVPVPVPDYAHIHFRIVLVFSFVLVLVFAVVLVLVLVLVQDVVVLIVEIGWVVAEMNTGDIKTQILVDRMETAFYHPALGIA